MYLDNPNEITFTEKVIYFCILIGAIIWIYYLFGGK